MTRTLQTIYNVSKKVAVGYRPRILDYHKKNEVIMDADGMFAWQWATNDQICLPGNGPPTTIHNKIHHNMCCCELWIMQFD
jgi:hypothetical protein